MDTITIPSHLTGLANAGQGGISAGRFAALLGGTARVRLLRRVPVDAPLCAREDKEGLTIVHGEEAIARVEAAEPVRREPPLLPSFAEALDAARRPLRHVRHPFSECVVCSPHRADGLGVVFAPSVRDDDALVAPLYAAGEFSSAGKLVPEVLWGSLDCPSFPAALLRERRLAVTGQLTAHVARTVEAGERLTVVGWQVSSGDRSHQTASAVIDEGGDLVAYADAVWVEVRTDALVPGEG